MEPRRGALHGRSRRRAHPATGTGGPTRMVRMALSRTALPVWVAALSTLLLAGCASLPPIGSRVASKAWTDTSSTALGRALASDVAAHPGRTGVHAIERPSDAFAARVLLADAAERSLDAQYYLWRADLSGTLMFDALRRAADRGVRVRLLLDDVNTGGLDETLAMLDAHPDIEVRLYNPFANRRARMADFASDFARVNRRMHNKSFTADNQVTIVGGRNIGDEYFGAGEGIAFADLDVIAAGAIVRDVSAAFDLYWNSPAAYPAASLLPPPGPDAAARFDAEVARVRADPAARAYAAAARETPLFSDLVAGRLPLEWTQVTLVRDDPDKTLSPVDRPEQLLLSALLPAFGTVERSFDLVSPYFVPGDDGTATLVRMAKAGVRVRVLTNSLATSDVSAVHAGYATRRAALLEAGVQLWEFKPPDVRRDHKRSITGSRAGSLHAKTFAADSRRIFVGSFNFDQRSARLNTEMGFVIESPALARRLGAMFDRDLPTLAWEVRRSPDGAIEWIETSASGETRHSVEPGTGPLERATIRALSVLPIEWLL